MENASIKSTAEFLNVVSHILVLLLLVCHTLAIYRPILTFGLETVYLNRAMYIKLESLQGTIVKAFFGLSRYSHHSKLLTALGILPI